MTAAFENGALLLAVQEVPQEHTRRYGIVRAKPPAELLRVDEIVENAPRWPRRAWA